MKVRSPLYPGGTVLGKLAAPLRAYSWLRVDHGNPEVGLFGVKLTRNALPVDVASAVMPGAAIPKTRYHRVPQLLGTEGGYLRLGFC
jgi:hypothetical protein